MNENQTDNKWWRGAIKTVFRDNITVVIVIPMQPAISVTNETPPQGIPDAIWKVKWMQWVFIYFVLMLNNKIYSNNVIISTQLIVWTKIEVDPCANGFWSIFQ